MSMTIGGRGLQVLRFGALATIAILAAACDDDPVSPVVATYQGEMAGSDGFDDLTGDASVEVGANAFEVAITLADYPAQGDGFPWILREGSCAAPGEEIGELADYPLIELDDDDEWTDVVELELDDDAEAYAIEVRRSGDEAEMVIACGDLAQD